MNLWANSGLDIKKIKIIHGGCRGADMIAARIAYFLGFITEEFSANWKYYGRGAGPIRNQKMLDDTKPSLVIAFVKRLSGGSLDMVTRARKAGIKVDIVWEKQP
jgi:hypothetical protein